MKNIILALLLTLAIPCITHTNNDDTKPSPITQDALNNACAHQYKNLTEALKSCERGEDAITEPNKCESMYQRMIKMVKNSLYCDQDNQN